MMLPLPTQAETEVPTVNWGPWLIVRIAAVGIASWMALGAFGFAVFWAFS